MVFKSKPHLQDLPEWGSTIYILCEGHGKLEEWADQAHWVGYSSNSQGHRVYWPGKRHVTTKWNITFDCSTVFTQHGDVTEVGVDAQTSSHTSSNIQLTRAPKPPHHGQDRAHDDAMHGFKPQEASQSTYSEGCGHHICKPSAYVHDICKG